MQAWLSDALCRLSTGGGFSTRTLYENDEETIFDALRPVVLNGIGELPTRGDLIDRSLLVSVPTVQEDRRQTEEEFWSVFDEIRTRILGSWLDAVSAAMKILPTVKMPQKPRMADFAE